MVRRLSSRLFEKLLDHVDDPIDLHSTNSDGDCLLLNDIKDQFIYQIIAKIRQSTTAASIIEWNIVVGG